MILVESVELMAIGYWKNLVNVISDTALHDELNEVYKLKAMGQLIKNFLITLYQGFAGQILDT